MRPLRNLIDVQDPGIVLLREWAGQTGANQSVVLPPDAATRGAALERLQVTTRSMLGALVYETGGLIIDYGRLRVFGSGPERSLIGINESAGVLSAKQAPPVLLVADDFIGGLFAINGGGFGQSEPGQIFHLAADDTSWSSLGIGYGDFIRWCLRGDLADLYEDFRTSEYFGAEETTDLTKVNSFHPFLWTSEARSGRPSVRLTEADESLRLRLELFGYQVAT